MTRATGFDPTRLMAEAMAEIEYLRDALARATRASAAIVGPTADPVAIVGAGCRFPGKADSLEDFWALLCGGVDAIREVPPERWAVDALFDPDPDRAGCVASRFGGFLDNIDRFDADFFRIGPREARAMDPQHRLVLETAVEALDHAGIAIDRRSAVLGGVFLGMTTSDYAHVALSRGGRAAIDAYFASGNTANAAAGRLAYALGLRGPAMAVDSACSSSLVAVHLACASLRNGECDIALAGGVNLILIPEGSIATSRAHLLAPDGRCKGFSDAADGYVRSEGCGMVVLKRLADAQAAGDTILAVIAGSAVNQDGASAGPTVPNGAAQEAVIRAALGNAGLAPADVQAVEAHGTGTALGDPIELRALAAGYGAGRSDGDALLVGSVKSNLGHLEAAAGIAGLLKAALMVEKGQVPPHLHCAVPTPQIEWETVPLRIPTGPLESWPGTAKRRRMGVSSFGFSGTNAHLIVEQAPDPQPTVGWTSPTKIFPISARSAAALGEAARRHAAVACASETAFAGLSRTAGEGRQHHRHRLAIVADGIGTLGEAIGAYTAARGHDGVHVGDADEPPVIAFMFAGQGAQRPGAGQSLYRLHPQFRAAIDECTDVSQDLLERPLRDVMFAAPGDSDIHRTSYSQPALVALEIALLRLWRQWGVEPQMVLGHSLGEISAAHAAGVFETADAIRFAAARGALMQAIDPPGMMAAVACSADRLYPIIAATGLDVVVSGDNGPGSATLSGTRQAVEAAIGRLQVKGIHAQPLRVSHAFHSPLMAPVVAPLRAFLSGMQLSPPRLRFVPALGGEAPPVESADYWCRQVLEPVDFAGAIAATERRGATCYLELGPAPLLATMGRRCRGTPDLVWLSSLRPETEDMTTMQQALAALYAAGAPVDWRGVWQGAAARRVRLPGYPWQRQSYWPTAPAIDARPSAPAPAILRRIYPLGSGDMHFDGVLAADTSPHILDHRLEQTIVVAGATHLAALIDVASQILGGDPVASADIRSDVSIDDIVFPSALALAEGQSARIALRARPLGAAGTHVELFSASPSSAHIAVLHLSGSVRAATTDRLPRVDALPEATQNEDALTGADFYRAFAAHGYALGPAFRWLDRIVRQGSSAAARLVQPLATDTAIEPFALHPGLIDAGFQLFSQCVPVDMLAPDTILAPFRIGRLRATGQPAGRSLVARASVRPGDAGGALIGDVSIANEDGTVLLQIEGFEARPLPLAAIVAGNSAVIPRYRVYWTAVPVPATSPTGQRWLIVGDAAMGRDLAAHLTRRGADCLLADVANTAARLAEFAPDRVVLLVPPVATGNDPEMHLAVQIDGSEAALAIVQQVVALDSASPPRIRVVTCGAEAALGGAGIAHGTIAGLVQALRSERGDLDLACVDIAGLSAEKPNTDALIDALDADPAERRRAIQIENGTIRHVVPRLQRASPPPGAMPAIRADGTYIITGGGGALGTVTARWLAQQGAGHIALLGRTLDADALAPLAAQIAEAGSRLSLHRCDITAARPLAAVLRTLRKAGPPLRGIVHAAGVLDDKLVEAQSPARLRTVLRPKLLGAMRLDALCADDPIDFFLLYSSAAALLGAPGQSNYAAANAFLDGFALDRQRRGRPAQSIAWGAWSPALGGMTSDAAGIAARLAAYGLTPLQPEAAMAALAEAMASADGNPVLMAIDWQRHAGAAPANPLWRGLVPEASGATIGTAAERSHGALAAALQSLSPAARRPRLETAVRARVAESLGAEPDRIDPRAGFFDLGMDSLSALELRNRLQADLGLPLPSTIAFQHPTVQAMVDRLLAAIAPPVVEASATPVAAAEPQVGTGDFAAIAGLSEADLAQLVDQELQDLLR